jgi:hypothetical protein
MKATRSGQVVGQAINEPSTDSNGRTTVVIFIKPGYQIINNSFVLGEEDVQLAGQPNGGITNAPDTGFIINQKGSGNIIQLQQGGVDKLLMANDGSLHISTTIAAGTVLEVKNNDTSLLSIDYVGTARFGGTLIVKKDVAVLGRVLGSTAVVGKNTSNQDIHQGDLLMLTGATDVPTLGDNPTVTVSPAVAGSNVVLVGIADRNLSDFNLDPEAPAPTDPTIIKPGEFVSIVITGTYKKVGLVGSISVGDKLTASGTAGKVQRLDSNQNGQVVGISLDNAPTQDGAIRIMLLNSFQQTQTTILQQPQTQPTTPTTPSTDPAPPAIDPGPATSSSESNPPPPTPIP